EDAAGDALAGGLGEGAGDAQGGGLGGTGQAGGQEGEGAEQADEVAGAAEEEGDADEVFGDRGDVGLGGGVPIDLDPVGPGAHAVVAAHAVAGRPGEAAGQAERLPDGRVEAVGGDEVPGAQSGRFDEALALHDAGHAVGADGDAEVGGAGGQGGVEGRATNAQTRVAVEGGVDGAAGVAVVE